MASELECNDPLVLHSSVCAIVTHIWSSQRFRQLVSEVCQVKQKF